MTGGNAYVIRRVKGVPDPEEARCARRDFEAHSRGRMYSFKHTVDGMLQGDVRVVFYERDPKQVSFSSILWILRTIVILSSYLPSSFIFSVLIFLRVLPFRPHFHSYF